MPTARVERDMEGGKKRQGLKRTHQARRAVSRTSEYLRGVGLDLTRQDFEGVGIMNCEDVE